MFVYTFLRNTTPVYSIIRLPRYSKRASRQGSPLCLCAAAAPQRIQHGGDRQLARKQLAKPHGFLLTRAAQPLQLCGNIRLLLLEPLRHVLPPAKARTRLRLLFRRDIVAALCFLRDPFHPFLLGFVVYRIGIATAFAWEHAAARLIRAGRDVK